jgi:hypothetical protein
VPAAAAAEARAGLEAELALVRQKIEARLLPEALADLRTLAGRAGLDERLLAAFVSIAEAQQKAGRPREAAATYLEMAGRFAGHVRAAEARYRAARLLVDTRQASAELDARNVLVDLMEGDAADSWTLSGLELKAWIEERRKLREFDATLQTSVPSALITYRAIVSRAPTAKPAEPALLRLVDIYDDMRRYEAEAEALELLGANFPATQANESWFRAGELYERRVKNLEAARRAYLSVPQGSRRFAEAQKRAARLATARP